LQVELPVDDKWVWAAVWKWGEVGGSVGRD
jgi:hypothetical protein